MNSAPARRMLIALALAALAFAAAAATDPQYGITYDEPIYASLGYRSAQWFAELPRQGLGAFHRQVIDTYWYAGKDSQPPLLKTFSGLCQLTLSGLVDDLTAMRLAPNALFGLGVGLVFLFASGLAGMTGGLAAALGYALLPRTFADSHYVVLDVAIATLSLATLAAFCRSATTGSRRWAAVGGLMLGLAALTKLNAFFLPPIVLGWQVLWQRRNLGWNALAMVTLAPLVFLAGWPWLWPDPWGRTAAYLAFHLKHYPVDTFYLGHTWHYAPWHYPWVMTALTIPTLLLLLAGLGVLAALKRRHQHPGGTLLLVGLVLSLGMSSLPFAPKYDGVRLFAPALIFLACLWGVGFGALAGWLRPRLEKMAMRPLLGQPPGRWLAGTMLLLVLAPSVAALSNLHPYQLAYYNALAGGPAGARRLGLETIYWGGGYQAALPYLNRLPAGSQVYVTPPGCVSLLEIYQRAGMLRGDLRWVAGAADAQAAAARLQECQAVLFQCAQAEMDFVSWPLYRSRLRPAWRLQQAGVPVMLAFPGPPAAAVVREAAGYTPSFSATRSSGPFSSFAPTASKVKQ